MSLVNSPISSTQQVLPQSNVAAPGAQAPLMPLLRYLSVVFFVALADALEQVWYIDHQQGRTVREAFCRLHIELCEPDAPSLQ